jgi:hypothetical protein
VDLVHTQEPGEEDFSPKGAMRQVSLCHITSDVASQSGDQSELAVGNREGQEVSDERTWDGSMSRGSIA